MPASVTPSREARNFTCASDAAPETYKTGFPCRARPRAAWRRMVDFPIPGSPPRSVDEAGTTPPPITRSNSAIPHDVRDEAVSATSVRRTGRETGKSGMPARCRGEEEATASSTSVFHSPHPGHFPTHLGEEVPHAVQANSTFTLAPISHQASTAAADMGMSTALRSVGLLDVVSTTPPGPSVARLVSTPISSTSLRTLVRNADLGFPLRPLSKRMAV